MGMEFEHVLRHFREKGYDVSYFPTAEAAASYLDGAIDGKTVGFGDSETLNTLRLYDLLSRHNEVIDPQHPLPHKNFWQTARCALTTEIFVTSVNAMAETGEMVNLDGSGNRVAGSLFGHDKVYFVAGLNKLAPTLEDAVWRAKNIAAPKNAARHGFHTPCAVKGDKCYDCKSPDRICCAQVIYYQKIRFLPMEVVFIGQPLGF